MINLFSILFTLGTVAFVTIRAAMLDKMLPWYQPLPKVVPGLKRKNLSGNRR